MGLTDRDYMQPDFRGRRSGWWSRLRFALWLFARACRDRLSRLVR